MPLTRSSSSTSIAQRSSFESFLDDYQILRLGISAGGILLLIAHTILLGWDPRGGPVGLVMVVVVSHATWCRIRRIRAPRVMLALDLTLWGWVMVITSDLPAITTASLAFLSVLTVFFTTGIWTAIFLVYLGGWHGASFFLRQDFSADSVSVYASLLFTVSALVLVMLRVRGWLGRLDANRSQMLGVVSHELRNNLTGMMGMTELVGSEDLAIEEMKELVAMAHHQAVDASEIVEDLLTASRLERSALSVDAIAVDVNAEVERTARRFQSEGKAIELVLAVELPMAHGDPLRVRQVLRNLLSNAERYGGSTIVVGTSLTDAGIEVLVADDGAGVPIEDENTIFLPYKRSASAERHPSSVGLGLWICRQLANAMGGSLEYRRVDWMTQFVLTLPVDGELAGSHQTASSAAGAKTLMVGIKPKGHASQGVSLGRASGPAYAYASLGTGSRADHRG